MDLFDEMPHIESKRLVLREFVSSDADALNRFSHNQRIYRLLPTFLYEQRYNDARVVIERTRAECFDTKESILLAICPRKDPQKMMGIAEIYAYEPRKPKASIGYRISRRYWGQGIATEVAGMLKSYLLDEVHMRTITAHVIRKNIPSALALKKNGLFRLYPGVWEDWGQDKPVLVDKWIYKRRWGNQGPTQEEIEKALAAIKQTQSQSA
ncbi:MAG: GNAT family N-acetyltransferase [Atopobiaceae bacterium]|nr:GNAT family N-acetyltransferase [Atopobiaceae bacterium]